MKKMMMMTMMIAMTGAIFAQSGNQESKMRKSSNDAPAVEGIVRMVQNPKMAKKLSITPEQSAKLLELNAGSRKIIAGNQKKLREAMEKQTALLKAQPIDEGAIMASVDEVFELRKVAAKEQMKKYIAVRTILTPQQIESAVNAMKEMRLKRGEKRSSRKANNAEKSSEE